MIEPLEKQQTFLPCGRCGMATRHTLLHTQESDFSYCDAEGRFGHEPATFHMFCCDGCTEISLRIWSSLHSPTSEFGERVHPPPVAAEPGIPEVVRAAYREAERVRRQSNVAYAVLARRVLETVVKERGISERNLSKALITMAARGDIPPLLAEATALMRSFGNHAAHCSKEEITGIHVEMIEKFLAALVHYLYVAPAALQEFKYLLEIDSCDSNDG